MSHLYARPFAYVEEGSYFWRDDTSQAFKWIGYNLRWVACGQCLGLEQEGKVEFQVTLEATLERGGKGEGRGRALEATDWIGNQVRLKALL